MEIYWSEPAENDLANIHNYISRDSRYYADRFIAKILNSVDMLKNLPRIGRKVPEADDENVRELLFQSYRNYVSH